LAGGAAGEQGAPTSAGVAPADDPEGGAPMSILTSIVPASFLRGLRAG
jgi:hypothetical protein